MATDETKTKSATDKAIDIAAKIIEWIKRIWRKVDEFQKKIQGWIEDAQRWLNEAQANSQAYIDRQIKKITGRIDKYHKAAQDWVNAQLKAASDWMNAQIDAIENGLKMAFARAELAILETASKKKLPASAVEGLAAAAPSLPLPRPSIPAIPIPKPDITAYLQIDMTAAFSQAQAAVGQVGAIASTDIKSTATDQVKNLIEKSHRKNS